MRNKWLIITALIALMMSAFPVDASAKGFNYLFLHNENDTVLGVSSLSPGATMTFSDDSIKVRDRGETNAFERADVKYFTYRAEAKSPFTVAVGSESDGTTGIQDVSVMLIGDAAQPYYGQVQSTDQSGKALFENLPYGDYTMYVQTADHPFEAKIGVPVSHKYRDDTFILLLERIGCIAHLSYTSAQWSDNSFLLGLEWKIISDDADLNHSFSGYRYKISFDGEEVGETYETQFTIDHAEAGEHYVELYGISPYGGVTETAGLLVSLAGTTAVEEIRDTAPAADWRYYNLSGIEVGSDNLVPGIYIRSNGAVSEKVYISGK